MRSADGKDLPFVSGGRAGWPWNRWIGPNGHGSRPSFRACPASIKSQKMNEGQQGLALAGMNGWSRRDQRHGPGSRAEGSPGEPEVVWRGWHHPGPLGGVPLRPPPPQRVGSATAGTEDAGGEGRNKAGRLSTRAIYDRCHRRHGCPRGALARGLRHGRHRKDHRPVELTARVRRAGSTLTGCTTPAAQPAVFLGVMCLTASAGSSRGPASAVR